MVMKPLLCHLHQLENEDVHLAGELSAEALGLREIDELIHWASPVHYDLDVQLLNRSILIRGSLRALLECECARCLKPFAGALDLDPWSCLLRLDGEDRVRLDGDCVDLTPFIREDIVLALPQHPLCEAECSGITKNSQNDSCERGSEQPPVMAPDWDKLNKLRF
jgi:uncharacterized metal-binding protein YceD (DUF177 family)